MTATHQSVRDQRRILWIDLETTGLDPEAGQILEAAAIVTDMEGELIGKNSIILKHPRVVLLDAMDNFVLKMHLDNGLLEACESRPGGDTVEQNHSRWSNFLAWIRTHVKEPRDTFLGGNSVHFDRSWLAQHVPDLLKVASHRMVDMSVFKVMAPNLYPDTRGQKVAHRAMADIEHSVQAYRHVLKQIHDLPAVPFEPSPVDFEVDI